MNSRSKTLALTGGCALLAAYGGSQASAQEAAQPQSSGLEEIVVTSQRRAESMQSVPIAITAMTSAELERKGISNFMDVARSSPSIVIQTGFDTKSTPLVFIRGQGNLNPGTINAEGAVGIYQDGFYNARAMGATLDMGDVERVEVLRGPQGTLYGRNTTGGAVNVISKLPTGEFGLKQSVDFGNFNMYRIVTSLNLPRWHDLSVKLTALKSGSDGNVRNLGPGNDFGAQKQTAGKLQMHFAPNSTFGADYFLTLARGEETTSYRQAPYYNGTAIAAAPGTTYSYFALSEPATVSYRPFNVPWLETRDVSQGLTLSWNVNDLLTIKSLTGYHTLRQLQPQSGDELYADALNIALGQNLDLEDRQFSQELQFVGDLMNGGLSYVAGLYYSSDAGTRDADSVLPGFGIGTLSSIHAKATSTAAFTQVTWRPEFLERRLELTAGTRFTADMREVGLTTTAHVIEPFFASPTEVMPNTRRNFHRFDPAFTVNYHWTGDLSTYAKVATGYRAGGIYTSTGGSYGALASVFEPEKLTSYEIGLKSDWFERRMRLNVAAFYSDFKDMQMVAEIDPNAPPGGPTRMTNAGQSAISGLEFEVAFNPVQDLNVALNYTFLSSDVKRVDVTPCSYRDNGQVPTPGGCPLGYNASSPYHVGSNIKDEFTIPFTPKHSFDLNANYTLAHFNTGSLSAYLDYRYQGDAYTGATAGPATTNRDIVRLRSRGLLDGRLTYLADLSTGQRVSVSVWGKNLTDKDYAQSLFGISKGIAGSITYYGAITSWAPPRTFGISGSYEF